MKFTGLFKQLKKRLRRAKRPLLVLGAVALVIVVAYLVQFMTANRLPWNDQAALEAMAKTVPQQHMNIADVLVQSGERRGVVLLKQYVCGAESQKLGKLDADSIMKLLMEHPEWEAQLAASGEVVMTEQIRDLSPKCKENAYMSLDKQGNLSLFDGPPKEDKVLRTFFQMNIDQLESSLPRDTVNKLYSGIRIKDFEEYNSVLSTFSDYAVEETEKVMSPSY